MARINSFFRTSLTTVIKCYQYCISGLLGNCCRFEPTCSTYTMEAIKLHGCSKGSVLGLKRILRCHPVKCLGGGSGYDPVK